MYYPTELEEMHSNDSSKSGTQKKVTFTLFFLVTQRNTK